MTRKHDLDEKAHIQLNKIEVIELFREYEEKGDCLIREELIKRNLYIAEILSKKYANRGIDYEDIYQVACVGLIYAVDRFDVKKGYEFTSFATPTIIGEIKKYFRDKGWAIKVPRRIQELTKKVNAARVILSQNLQRSPTIDDISQYLSCTAEEVLEAMEAGQVYAPQSLDLSYESNTDDKDISLVDIIGESDKHFTSIENKDFFLKIIDKLNDLEKKILKDRYFKNKTQVEIAKEINMSQMTVSRIEKKLIDRFRRELKRSYS